MEKESKTRSALGERKELEQEEQHDIFMMNTLREIRLMGRDIFSNPIPLREQPDILRKIRILNYALAEWNDEFDRRYGHLKLNKRRTRSKEEILNEILQKYF